MFDYSADEVLVIVTVDRHVYMIKPKEEDNPITKDLSADLGNSQIEGAKIHENSLILLTTNKQVFIVNDLNDFNVEVMCDSYSGKDSVLKN